MFKSFADLQKGRGAFDDLQKEVEKMSKGGFQKEDDGTYWQPTADKTGNGFALIRFLPPPKGESTPFVRFWSHGFKGPTNKWYIELSRTTLNEADPVGEYNTQLWNSGGEGSPERKQASAQKRKLSYVSNILVLKDPASPENEGKVFRYKYGKKIFDKIKEAMTGDELAGTKPVNPFDMWEGANFNLKIRKVDGNRNYDLSFFDQQTTAVSTDNARCEEIWNSEHPLLEIIDPKNFKSYEDLKKRLDEVMKWKGVGSSAEVVKDPVAEAVTPKSVDAKELPSQTPETVDESNEDSIDFFRSLARESVGA